MLADLFYLSTIWLVLACGLALWLGTRWRRGNFFLSAIYLGLVIGLGDIVGIIWLKEPIGVLAIGSAGAFCLGLLFSLALRDWNAPGQTFFLFSTTTAAAYLLYAFAITALSPLSFFAFIFSFLLFLLEAAALSLSLTYAFEVLDVLCRIRWRRRAVPKTLGAYRPMVSLHVPAYNEPPELVEKTLRALAHLDYPNYEIILVDNNTPDEAAWQPLAKVCRELGFKCLHLDHWPGYKSGALNFALTLTDPRAEIIGVIDADYIVQPDYLSRIVPYFENSKIAFVQTPQDYRDYEDKSFFRAAYDGYKYFFSLSMPARNERNAIIFCGTMGLLRKRVLQEIGGWDEWCITEDAEASLRMLNRGHESLYIDETFGRGLMPLDFEGLKKQRFRWAFGGVQILKKHWNKLMPWASWIDPENKLTGRQRYFYLMSGLQWFNELLTFAFTVMVLISVALTLASHTAFLRPTSLAFVILPVVLIGTNMTRAVWGLRYALGLSWRRALNALTLWFSLTWVVALACVQAVIRKRGVFLRTPKSLTNSAVAKALQAASLETVLGAMCVLGGLAVLVKAPTPLTFGLLLICLSQGLIYLSAPIQSLLSVAGNRRGLVEPDRSEIYGTPANESHLGLQFGFVAVAALLAVLIVSLFPVSNRLPRWYAVVNPQPLISPHVQPIANLPDPAQPAEVVPTEVPTATEAVPAVAPTATNEAPGGVTDTPGSGATATPAGTATEVGATPSAPAPADTETPTAPAAETATLAPTATTGEEATPTNPAPTDTAAPAPTATP